MIFETPLCNRNSLCAGNDQFILKLSDNGSPLKFHILSYFGSLILCFQIKITLQCYGSKDYDERT